MTCPICKKAVKETDPQYPFCSERCRVLDLGNWASEEYKIPTEAPVDPESYPPPTRRDDEKD